MEAGVSMDLRFGNFHEGKNAATTGGINSNDKKAVYLKSNMLGTVQWGVINSGDNFYLATKPYMVEPKDLEIVKYGIATYRMEALTSRNTTYTTPTLNLGSFAIMGLANYAIGDGHKSGANDATGVLSGDAYSVGMQFKAHQLRDRRLRLPEAYFLVEQRQ